MQSQVHPNPAMTQALREEIRARLYRSLQHLVCEVFRDSGPSALTEADLQGLICSPEFYPGPTIFALHGVLLQAALAQDSRGVPEALAMLQGLAQRGCAAPARITVSAMDPALLHPDELALLQRAYADDVGLTTQLQAPPAGEVAQLSALIAETLETLADSDAAWHAEVDLLARQIYLAIPAGAETRAFGGAAVFDAFGSILLNPRGLQDSAAVLMALIHESSHQQLFAFHLDDPIVLNDAEARFTSPLRRQPRPMEGIFHALWVSARMALAAEAVLAAHPVPGFSDALHARQQQAMAAFADCKATVTEHAELTARGESLLADATQAIDGL